MKNYLISNKYVLRKIVDESILVPISPALKSRDCLYVLNHTGQTIYEGIKNKLNLTEIIKKINQEYADPSKEVKSEVEQFIEQMVSIEAFHEPTGNIKT